MTAVTETPAWIAEITMAQLEKDPYPFYARLRREAPVAFVPALGLHIASTRAACQEIGSQSDIWDGVISPAGG
ncbi:MAG: cytochrome, partial [Modestobacter sp.]|nr:cytochrome [Modestobacter sp.]